MVTFTGAPLVTALEVTGRVSARLRVSADTGRGHVFVRLCDVDARGHSVNVCDGLATVDAEAGAIVELTIPMGDTAHRFDTGHRVRWQVSGGAHPRFARHPGTAETAAAAVTRTAVEVTLHPGCVLLLPAAEDG